MRDAKKIVDKLKKYVTFKDKSEEEEIQLYFYIIYKWAQDRNYDIFIVLKEVDNKAISISILFKSIGGVVFDLDSKDTCVLEIKIKGTTDTFKKEIKSVLTQFLLLMEELDRRNDGFDSFLGGDVENDFF